MNGRKPLTIPEVAKRLGVSRSLAYEAARRGEIPAIRIGKRVLVPAAALDKMLCEAAGANTVVPKDTATATGTATSVTTAKPDATSKSTPKRPSDGL
jgi:excisionase family DNA binding protein